MADANQRVVVARDARGAFVARQRVAISEATTGWCARRSIRWAWRPAVTDAFLQYDHRSRAGAGAAPVPCGDGAYEVVGVLARADYDDGSGSASCRPR
jgi:hypothetical protein